MILSQYQTLFEQGLREQRAGVVGLVLVRGDGRVFSQKRSPHRRLFPGCWDLVGGHVEPGEDLESALNRELYEETGWTITSLLGFRKLVDWESMNKDGTLQKKREFVFAVRPQGNLDRPRLETDKVTQARWFGPNDLSLLLENRLDKDRYVYELVSQELLLHTPL